MTSPAVIIVVGCLNSRDEQLRRGSWNAWETTHSQVFINDDCERTCSHWNCDLNRVELKYRGDVSTEVKVQNPHSRLGRQSDRKRKTDHAYRLSQNPTKRLRGSDEALAIYPCFFSSYPYLGTFGVIVALEFDSKWSQILQTNGGRRATCCEYFIMTLWIIY